MRDRFIAACKINNRIVAGEIGKGSTRGLRTAHYRAFLPLLIPSYNLFKTLSLRPGLSGSIAFFATRRFFKTTVHFADLYRL
jgi:hypothetical protein